MKRIHFLSGLLITVFIGLHLSNHLISIFGIEAHLNLMDNLRLIYRNKVGESILLIAVFVQVISGLKIFLSKRKSVTCYYERLQMWTGLYLAFFLLIHVSAVLIGRYILTLDTNFYFGVAGLNTFPFTLFFAPYYGLAIIAFFGHLSAIHYQKMKKQIFGFSVDNQSRFIQIVGFIVTIVTLYGLTNGFTGVEIPEAYNILIGK